MTRDKGWRLAEQVQPPLCSSGRIFLINVGANAAHGRLRSPRFADGRFEFVPIPETAPVFGPPMLRYRDLRSFYYPDRDLSPYLPGAYLERYTHADPDLFTPGRMTYGDHTADSPRAFGLRKAGPGDWLFFLARLVDWDEKQEAFTERAGFYLVAGLHIARVFCDLSSRPLGKDLALVEHNAHVRLALAAGVQKTPVYSVFVGSSRSWRFEQAIPLTEDLVAACLRDRNGQPYKRPDDRTLTQVIGSYTRSCRCVIDPATADGAERAERWWQRVLQREPGGAIWKGERRESTQ